MVETFRRRPLCFFGNPKLFSENWQSIAEYELSARGLFLNIPRFTQPGTFLGDMLKIESYADACDRSPFEKASINWGSGIGIGGILVINGEVDEFFR